jgi:hypothetical protein
VTVTSKADSVIGALADDLPGLGIDLAESPVTDLIPGLDVISISAQVGLLSLVVGASLYHIYYQGTVAPTINITHCNSPTFQGGPGDPFGTGVDNIRILHARCGVSNSDTFAASPKNSFSTEGQWWSFWNYVINATTVGGLYPVAAVYCHGKSPCYVRGAPLSEILTLAGPSSQTHGTSESSCWANPSTGTGITSQADPYNCGQSTPNPQCLQESVILPCSSVSPTGGPVGPAYGWPSPWPNDEYANADANELRCELSPQTFGCPQAAADGSGESDSTGGPLITMPNCQGLTVGECEGEIDSALASAGSSTTAAFSTTVAPTYNPNIGAGLVQATIVAAGTVAAIDAVTIEINEPQSDGNCQSQTAYPHTSTTQLGRGLVDAKGRVQCATDQTVTFNVELWKCTSRPDVSASPDEVIDQLNTGAWGCDTSWPAGPFSVDVVAGAWSPQKPAFATEGPDQTAYYIAATFGPGIDSSISQMIPGSSMAVLP